MKDWHKIKLRNLELKLVIETNFNEGLHAQHLELCKILLEDARKGNECLTYFQQQEVILQIAVLKNEIAKSEKGIIELIRNIDAFKKEFAFFV